MILSSLVWVLFVCAIVTWATLFVMKKFPKLHFLYAFLGVSLVSFLLIMSILDRNKKTLDAMSAGSSQSMHDLMVKTTVIFFLIYLISTVLVYLADRAVRVMFPEDFKTRRKSLANIKNLMITSIVFTLFVTVTLMVLPPVTSKDRTL